MSDSEEEKSGEEEPSGSEIEDSDEEEEEGLDEFEKDDFIVDEDEEEEDVSDEEEKRKKKKEEKKKKKRALTLDDEDFELLEEAGYAKRPKKSADKGKKLRRLAKGTSDMVEATPSGLEDEVVDVPHRADRAKTGAELERQLFGNDADMGDDGEADEEDEEEDLEDEMADFIVDGDVDEQGRLIRKKKKKNRGPSQVSSYAVQEAQEIFGDVSELLELRASQAAPGEVSEESELEELEEEDEDAEERRVQRSAARESRRRQKANEAVEPSVIKEQFLSERDELSNAQLGPAPNAIERLQEAQWIYERAFVRPKPEFEYVATDELGREAVVGAIEKVLGYLHVDHFEIPFIAMYRKEYCQPLLPPHMRETKPEENAYVDMRRKTDPMDWNLQRWAAFWAVMDWDRKWRRLQQRKRQLVRLCKAALTKGAEDAIITESVRGIEAAMSETALEDVDAKFRLFCEEQIHEAAASSGHRRPLRRVHAFYHISRKAGLDKLAQQFGLSASDYADNLTALYKKHDVDPESERRVPEDLASDFITEEMPNHEFVLKGARHMVVCELAAEPAIRQYVREKYREHVLISTRPTPSGDSTIDAFHRFGFVKWLKDKPFAALAKDQQWVAIQKAMQQGLLEVTLEVPADVLEHRILYPMFEGYLSDNVSTTAKTWNELRKEVLREAVVSHLFPVLDKEVRGQLASDAREWVAEQCANRLWFLASTAPYVIKMGKDEVIDRIKVLSSCWGDGSPATTFAVLDAMGELVDVLFCGQIPHNRFQGKDQRPAAMITARQQQEFERLQSFIEEHAPQVAIVGGANMHCRRLVDNISEAFSNIVQDNPRAVDAAYEKSVGVVYGSEEIPRLFEATKAANEELGEHPAIVRRAIALGRYFQNPLAVLCGLCGAVNNDLLILPLHPFQDCLPQDQLWEALERVLITIVGVDINAAAAHKWLAAPLQFVSGLGPRKAAALLRGLQRNNGRCDSRKELLIDLGLGKCVFVNCAAVLRVRGSGLAANNDFDVLDDTRIHPESYDYAKKMAFDAVNEEGGDEEDEEEAKELAVDQVISDPAPLAELDLAAYADQLEAMDKGKKLATLEDIRLELTHPYRDPRRPYDRPNRDEEFYMLCGESPESLRPGKLLQATVARTMQNDVFVRLENGINGKINIHDLSDQRVDSTSIVKPGQVVTCRVLSVDTATYTVLLSSKGEVLRDNARWETAIFGRDPFYRRPQDAEVKKEAIKKKKQGFLARSIVHPLFKNISVLEATQALSDREIGDVVLRPSTKGVSHLSLTMKFWDGIYFHVDIKEGGKTGKSQAGNLRLGTPLQIRDEFYDDLDEVLARYVEPLAANIKEMQSHRKFMSGSKQQIDDALRAEKAGAPSSIPYHFGAFMLGYIVNQTPRHEYIIPSDKGFRFRSQDFTSVDKLLRTTISLRHSPRAQHRSHKDQLSSLGRNNNNITNSSLLGVHLTNNINNINNTHNIKTVVGVLAGEVVAQQQQEHLHPLQAGEVEADGVHTRRLHHPKEEEEEGGQADGAGEVLSNRRDGVEGEGEGEVVERDTLPNTVPTASKDRVNGVALIIISLPHHPRLPVPLPLTLLVAGGSSIVVRHRSVQIVLSLTT
eukprot:jgi/Chlat1/879/Chrsp107S01340